MLPDVPEHVSFPELLTLLVPLRADEVLSELEMTKGEFLRHNPPIPAKGLPAGTSVIRGAADTHGADKGAVPFIRPFTVGLQEGATLYRLSEIFQVPLEILLDQNCPRGEEDARRIPVGTRIVIPLFQVLGTGRFALEGLQFNKPSECSTISTRLLNDWNGPSIRREHLAVAFQHISPKDRAAVLDTVVTALDSIDSPRAVDYADALRACKNDLGIENPFRLSPASLVAVVEARRALRDGTTTLKGGRPVTVIACKGDGNGAFPTLDGVVESAGKAGLDCFYFEVGTVSAALAAAKEVSERCGGGDIVIAGHGNFDEQNNLGQIHLAFKSVILGHPDLRHDLILQTTDTWALGELARCTAEGGTIVFVSCHAAHPDLAADTMVKTMATVALRLKKHITVLGGMWETNVREIIFNSKEHQPFSSLSVTYHTPSQRICTVDPTKPPPLPDSTEE